MTLSYIYRMHTVHVQNCYRAPEVKWVNSLKRLSSLNTGKHQEPRSLCLGASAARRMEMRSLQSAQVFRLPQICSVPTQAILGDQETDNRINQISKAVMTSPKQTSGWTPTLCIYDCILSRWIGEHCMPHHHWSQFPSFPLSLRGHFASSCSKFGVGIALRY